MNKYYWLVVQLKAFTGPGRGLALTMIVSPPLETDLYPSDSEWDNASMISSVGAMYDKKEHGSDITKSFETHIGKAYGRHWGTDFAGNKIPNTINLEKSVNSVDHCWPIAWNYTMRLLKSSIKDLIQNSKEWPDNGFGGKRCVKQLSEILVLKKYVPLICDVTSKKLLSQFDLQKKKLSNKYSKLSIHPSDEDMRSLESLTDEIHELSKHYKRLTCFSDAITQNIINDFYKNTIKTNTIKKACDQERVNGFVQNPTVEGFEQLCKIFWKTSWKSHVDKQHNGWNKFGEEQGVDFQDEDFDEPSAKRKRISHSEQEKLRIKKKTNCICVGLPRGLLTCPFSGQVRSHVMLTHEHRIPVSLDGQTALQMSLEEDINRWGMCKECDTIKTHYIDPFIRKHNNDLELLKNYLNNYRLPEQIIEEIKLNIKMDGPETTKPITSANKKSDTTGNTVDT